MEAGDAVLIYTTYSKDEDGYPIETTKEIPVYIVREKSATRSEVYAARNAGVDVRLVLEIRPEDYELSRHADKDGKREYARKIRYDGGTYEIARAWLNEKSMMELSIA